ncbi:MAG: ABC-F family ATP-binding cassette domain-containing protein [Leptolinea sp.]|jgi:ATP-binding cassette subfamily F protein 3|nr:ABC-F family ATP-binding cassette domain-containing protein [Leptolinea sp.]
MPLLTTERLGKSFGAVDLFDGISVSIPEKGRIGLVGPNGVGKTTFLRIINGEEEASRGAVFRARGLRTGYLPQESDLTGEQTLWQECLQPYSSLMDCQKELHRLEEAMSKPDAGENLLESYGRLQHEFEMAGGYLYETRIRQTLTGLGFAADDHNRPLSQLSGGQRTRALLARLLLTQPDLLLLDEPTNHLDIKAVEWLEDTLKDFPGAVLVISHDRFFLDQVADTIWEMDNGFETYHGNYSAYQRQREERRIRLLKEMEAQQEFIQKEQEYIRRNLAGQNTRQAQGRRKRLERYLEEKKLDRPAAGNSLRLDLKPAQRSGDLVLKTHSLSVGYADEGRPLFMVPDLILLRGECAAVIGPNGAGKTTLLKTLLGQIPPLDGEAALGASLKIGYFAQAHEGLDPRNTLVEEINRSAPKMLPAEVRDYLAKFLFTGDDVFKTVSLLSGGERGRLALACLALSGANLLLLDEPTNHLDLASQDALQAVLQDFNGTILLVSHDRYLIDALATQIWDVQPEERLMKVFPGTYSEYAAFRRQEKETETRPENEKKSSVTQAAGQVDKAGSSKSTRKQQEEMKKLEADISRLENELDVISRQLENPMDDPQEVVELGSRFSQIQQELEEQIRRWETLSSEM